MTSIFETLKAIEMIKSDAKLDIVCSFKEIIVPADAWNHEIYDFHRYVISIYKILQPESFRGVVIGINPSRAVESKAFRMIYEKNNFLKFRCTPEELRKYIFEARK